MLSHAPGVFRRLLLGLTPCPPPVGRGEILHKPHSPNPVLHTSYGGLLSPFTVYSSHGHPARAPQLDENGDTEARRKDWSVVTTCTFRAFVDSRYLYQYPTKVTCDEETNAGYLTYRDLLAGIFGSVFPATTVELLICIRVTQLESRIHHSRFETQ